MASTVHDKGFLQVTLKSDKAELIHKVMQRAECSPAAALGWLLGIAGAELDLGGWDARSASQKDVQGVVVNNTNLDRLCEFVVGDTVVVNHTKTALGYQLIGVVSKLDLGAFVAEVALTEGTRKRSGKTTAGWEPSYTCPIEWLMEL